MSANACSRDHILLQPERYLMGACGFTAAAVVTHVVQPTVGALFGTLFFPIGGVVYQVLNDCWKDDAFFAKIAKLAIALLAAIGSGFLLTAGLGFKLTLTLTQGALFIITGLVATYALKFLIGILEEEFAPDVFLTQ